MRTYTRTAVGAFAAASLLALAACGDDGGDTAAVATAGPSSSSAAGAGSLAGACPSTVVVQTDWNPEAEHGGLYQLVGDGYTIDKEKLRVTGPLLDGGVDTGVKIEVRAGGPAIGYQQVTSQMYSDPDIDLGYVFTDEAIQNSAKQPTLAVLAPLEVNPQMIMWDPATYPDVKTIADLGRDNITTLYFETGTYMQYLLGQGVLKKDQVDGSYDGAPARWVAENGKVAQQGFATAEPYIYEHEVEGWNKPVAYQLINDAGYPNYASSISIVPDRKAELAPCLEKLVPIMQRAEIGYLTDPAKANKLILELVDSYNNGWVYSQGVADFAHDQMDKLGIVGNGPDATLGNFDTSRVEKLIGILDPIFAADNEPLKPGLKPEDVVTNEFIDPAIGIK